MPKEKIPTFRAGDRFETIYRQPNQQGVVLKRERVYRQYACSHHDLYKVRFDDGHEELLWRIQYTCKKLARGIASQA